MDPLAEYRRSIPELERFYEQITASGAFTKVLRDLKGPKSLALREDAVAETTLVKIRLSLKVNRLSKLLVEEVEARKEGALLKVDRVRGSNPEYSFQLAKDKDGRNYALSSMGDKTQPSPLRSDSITSEHINAPHRLHSESVASFVDPALVDIRSTERVNWEGIDSWKITFESRPENKSEIRGGWIIVAPSLHWALLAYKCDESVEGFPEEFLGVCDGRIEYGPLIDGFPSIKKIDIIHFRDRQVVEFDKFSHEDVPASEFKLAAFGLPEVGEISRGPSYPRTPLLFIGAGIIALGAAFFLWRAATRGAAKAPRAT